MSGERCPWSIRWGTTDEATTRCDKAPHPALEAGQGGLMEIIEDEHAGPGLLPGQRVRWLPGDRREYTGDWPGYCQKTAPLAPFLDGGCTLPEGHRGRCAP